MPKHIHLICPVKNSDDQHNANQKKKNKQTRTSSSVCRGYIHITLPSQPQIYTYTLSKSHLFILNTHSCKMLEWHNLNAQAFWSWTWLWHFILKQQSYERYSQAGFDHWTSNYFCLLKQNTWIKRATIKM